MGDNGDWIVTFPILAIQADVTTKLFVPNDKDVLENKNSRKTKRRKISNKIAGTSEIGANIIHECSSQAEDKFPIVHLPWTDTFKPNSRKDLIAYENGVVDGIYNWLRNFNDARMEKLKLDKYLRESNSNFRFHTGTVQWVRSISAFIGDSDSDAYDYVVKNPFTPGIVVHGHTGVGKTSLVYALCTEAGFNVSHYLKQFFHA